MKNIFPENYNEMDIFTINLVDVNEEIMEGELGGVSSNFDKITSVLSEIFKDGDISLEFYGVPSGDGNEEPKKKYVECRLVEIDNNYLGDDGYIVDQSYIGGTELTLVFDTNNGQEVVPITVGSSSVVINKVNKTVIITSGLGHKGETLDTVVISY